MLGHLIIMILTNLFNLKAVESFVQDYSYIVKDENFSCGIKLKLLKRDCKENRDHKSISTR